MNKFKLNRLFGFTIALALVIGILMACDEAVEEETPPVTLAIPQNITITVVDRLMTVTWDEVANAQGYEITTTSENCGSGNWLINTKDITAYSYTEAAGVGTTSVLKSDKSNGAVAILAKNKIEITLMPATNNPNTPMASAVSAKVKALGGTSGDTEYLDSAYSAVVTEALGGM